MTSTNPVPQYSKSLITLNDFYRAYSTFRKLPNDEQAQAIAQPPDAPLFIVAGPGTGKTTCLSLRILKLILVDGIIPKAIIATTFTKKAAAELRSRILGWGFQLIEALQADPEIAEPTKAQLTKVDINQILTGTIDSLCEQILRDFRDPATQPPILADDFVSKTLLLRAGLFNNRRDRDSDLDEYLLDIQGSKWGWNIGKKVSLLQVIWDRRFQDRIDWDSFLASGTSDTERSALNQIGSAIADYQKELSDRLMVDFALLEYEVLKRLQAGKLTEFFQQIQIVLVDEYQDTNPLQESIYFELAKACNGAIAVVGDDDQSLYRFRGATVELFSNFSDRYEAVFGNKPTTIFLRTNYRSTQNIIQFVNNYATLDLSYQTVRVKNKPSLLPRPNADAGIPILGMFRQDMDTLAKDLADFIAKVFRDDGYTIPDGNTIQANSAGGDVGDCALLCSSPAEYNSSGNPRLPLLLRQKLAENSTIEVFNPRGQDLTEIEVVAQFGGLLLECLDPAGAIETTIKDLSDIVPVFTKWREIAIDFASSQNAPNGLLAFAQSWAERNPKKAGFRWSPSVPVLELIYGLLHYFPLLHNDPEGQIYLEVFTRQVSACQQVGKFSGRIITDPDNSSLSEASVKELLRNFLAPIASGTVKVNEDLMEAFPRDRLSILSIHQSKGLEFPLTIVDVGSDFKTNHHAHKFKRFPDKGGTPHTMEDLLRPHTDLNVPSRDGRDRTFDDLYRQYFVAYSRPQEVLLLVGLKPTLPEDKVSNVATGWNRDNKSTWKGNRPFIEI
jgi:DNA helicase-2/ATP-dependent DNA helicase PcrA